MKVKPFNPDDYVSGGGSRDSAKNKTVEEYFAEKTEPVGELSLKDQIPGWVVIDKLNSQEQYGYSVADSVGIKRETEKAILVSASTEWGRIEFWCPKSVLLTPEHYEKQNTRAMVNAAYTNYLLATAKEHGVKLGNTRSWEKVTAKLGKNGIDVKTRDEFMNTKVGDIPDENILKPYYY